MELDEIKDLINTIDDLKLLFFKKYGSFPNTLLIKKTIFFKLDHYLNDMKAINVVLCNQVPFRVDSYKGLKIMLLDDSQDKNISVALINEIKD